MSDYLLTTIAIEAHHLGVSRNIERNPSNGILAHWYDSKEISTEEKQDIHSAINKRIIMSFADRQNVHLYYRSLRNNELKVFIDEPRGTVGRRWRQFLIRYYGPIILFPPMKVLILVCFTLFCLVSLYGCLNLETGLELKDLASVGSYLNDFDITQAEYFEKYDFPVDIFFPNFTEWWRVESHAALLELHNEILETGVAKFLANPMLHMLADKDLRPFLQSGNQEEFQKTLHAALMMEKGKYKQFEQNFVWEGSTLRAWKFQMLPGFMQHSSDRAQWMTKIRQICRTQAEKSFPLQVMGWNYMMLYYESDLEINSSVTSNMVVAAFTMFIISIFGMPKMIAAFLVILVMVMIDIGIIGFMFFWNIRMNMVSMICLLIAIGFSVDFSAHVCHTFMETEGQTRNQRVLETLVLMGNPVFHGAASSILGVLMLGFSESYIFRIFFKMMTLVMTFALFHSVIFLPVVLSVLGNSKPQSIGSKEGGLSPPKSSPPDEVYFHRKRMSDKILDDKSNEKNYDLWNNNSIENGRQNRQIMPYHFRGDQWCGDSFSLKKSLSSSKHRANNTSVRVFSKEPLVTRNKRIKKTRLYENKPKSLQSTNGHLSYSEDGYAKLGHISSELDMMQHTLRLHGISCWKQCREEPLNQGIPSRVMLLPLKEDVIRRKNGSYQTHTNSSMHSSDAIISASRSTDYSFYKDLSKRCNTNSDAQSFSLKLRGHPCKAQHPSFSVKGYQYMTIPCHERPFTSFSPQAKTNGAEKAVLFHVAQPSCHENARYNSYPSGSINLKHVTDASLRHGNRFDSTSWLTNFSDTNSSPYCTIQFWTAQKVDASNRQVLHSICWSKLHSTSVNDYSSSKFSMHSKYFQQDQSPTIGSGRTKAFSCGLHV